MTAQSTLEAVWKAAEKFWPDANIANSSVKFAEAVQFADKIANQRVLDVLRELVDDIPVMGLTEFVVERRAILEAAVKEKS